MGVWAPDDAAYYINQRFRGTEWPGPSDPSFASVAVCCHINRKGSTNGNMRMLPPSRAPNDCDGYENTNLTVSGMVQGKRVTGLYGWQGGTNSAILTHNVSNALVFGTGDLTAEGWLLTNVAPTGGLWDFRASTADAVRPDINMVTGKLGLFFSNAQQITAAAAVSTGVWHHFAWCRSSGTSFLYLDGVSVGSVADAVNYGNCASCAIGNNVAGSAAGAQFVDEYRLTLGVARYPGGTTFTVPSLPFPDY